MDDKANLSFLDQVKRGQAQWWRYFFGFVLILFFWLVLGSLFLVGLLIWVMIDGNPETAVDMQTGFMTSIHPILNFTAANLSFVILILGVFLAIRFVHERPFLSLITPLEKLNWRRIGQGFGLWLLLVMLASLVEYVLTPEIYTVVFNARRFLPFAIVVLLLTPIQTTAEEVLFRGYLLQTSGHFGRNFWVLALVNGILFMIPHLANPELAIDAVLLPLFYLSIGAFFAFVTLRDDSAELVIGAHASNNLYSALFANYTNSALQTESIFLVTELDAVYALAAFWAMAIIFYLLLVHGRSLQKASVGEAINE